MPLAEPKRIQVLREYRDGLERGKVFGRVQMEWDGDPEHADELVYETHRVRKEHFHRNLLAWAVSVEIMDELVAMGVDKLRIRSRPFTESENENEVFEVHMGTAIKDGEASSSGGYEPQFFVPESSFYDPREVWF